MLKRPLLTFSLTSSFFAAAITVVQVLPSTATALYSPLDEGVRQFHARRYAMALGPLERAVSKAPHNAMCRYYLAGCYVHLNRHEDAQREYDMSYRLDPFGPVSGYCRRALLGYGKSVPSDSDLAELKRPIASVTRPATGTFQYNSTHSINKAVDTIRRQADFEKGRHKQTSDTFASNAMRTGEGAARKILDDADNEIRGIMDAPLVVAGGAANWALQQHAKELELQRRQQLASEIRKRAENDAARIRAEANDRSQKYKQYSQDRQAALDEVADSLESQLSSSRLKDRVKMRAEGTGLYVRNFGVVPSPSPEVHQSVARIRPHENPRPADEPIPEPTSDKAGGTDKLPSAESAGDNGKLPTGETTAPKVPEHSVRGKVLEKI
jgi:ribosome-associated translation inhibitor RaiA